MPTYRNDGNVTVKMKNYLGNEVVLYPGVTIATHEVLGNPFTKISDAPYYSLEAIQDTLEMPDSISNLSKCKHITVTTGENQAFMKCNSKTNPIETTIPANSVFKFTNTGEIHTLFFSAEEGVEGATVKIEGYENTPPEIITVVAGTGSEEPPV